MQEGGPVNIRCFSKTIIPNTQCMVCFSTCTIKNITIHEGNYIWWLYHTLSVWVWSLAKKSRARRRCCTHLVFFGGVGKDFNKSNQINVIQRGNLLLQGSLQGGALVLRWSPVIFVIRFLIGGILMEWLHTKSRMWGFVQNTPRN